MKRSVEYSGRKIVYELEYKKVKNINLRIKTDGSVRVSAPAHADVSQIDSFVSSKGRYILHHLDRFSRYRRTYPSEHTYRSGDVFRICGRDLKLEIISASYSRVTADENTISVETRYPEDPAGTERLLTEWMRKEIMRICTESAARIHRRFHEYDIPSPMIKIRKMKRRWGSCQPYRGIITMNLRLIEAAPECVEFVMMHEFCHFVHPDHSRAFYSLLTSMMPEWREYKKLLEESVMLTD